MTIIKKNGERKLFHVSTISFSAITSNVEGGIDMCRYEKHGEMVSRLRNLERQYGRQGLVKIGSIGKSVSGRDLIYVKISRNATGPRKLTEPMFKYV